MTAQPNENLMSNTEMETVFSPIGQETPQQAAKRLAALDPLDYEQVREREAETLGVRVGSLDKAVFSVRREMTKERGSAGLFNNVEPWPAPVNVEMLLGEIRDAVRRFIVCEPETTIATALWCAFTWVVDHVQVAPLAIITAPEKRCGKSQLLTLIGLLSRRPLVASNISPSAMFRVIEAHSPTLLIDEADTFFKENEELRGVINSGHSRQSAFVIRNVGDDHEPMAFSTWGAKAICGIGTLAETIMDRAVVLELRRKLPTEKVERLRHAEAGLFERISAKLARFAEDSGHAIERARPSLPDALNDRAQDNWEPLLAIADYAGGEWPELARKAALKISGAENEAISLSVELLADIKELFEHNNADRMTSQKLIEALCVDDERPWATYNKGHPISPRQLSKRLAEYGIASRDLKLGISDVKKGYRFEQFSDAFDRYLSSPLPSSQSATPLPSANYAASKVAQQIQVALPTDLSATFAEQHGGRTDEAINDDFSCVVAESSFGSATTKRAATLQAAPFLSGSVVADKLGVAVDGDIDEGFV